MGRAFCKKTVAACLAVVMACSMPPVAYADGRSPSAPVAEQAASASSAAALSEAAATAVSASFAEGTGASGELVVVLDGSSDSASARARSFDAADAADAAASSVLPEEAAQDVLQSGARTEALSENAVLVRTDSDDAATRLARELSQAEGVAYVQPNYVYELPENLAQGVASESSDASADEGEDAGQTAEPDDALAAVPSDAESRALAVNDPLWADQGYLRAVGFDEAWSRVRTDGSVSVAVLDSTANVAHEDLAGALDLAHAWDAANQAPYGTAAAEDHGTEVAGIISAVCDNRTGIAGASYGANVIPINVFGPASGRLVATTATLLRAMDWLFGLVEADASLNVRVVNLSLGGYGEGMSTETDRAFRASIAKAVDDYGMAVVSSGGNQNTSRYSWPADWDEVVSVTAVDETLSDRAWFSDYNEHKDIAAPGEKVMAPSAAGTSDYQLCEGTSFSAPLVSAALALMFAADPSLSVDRALAILYGTAEDLGAPGRDDSFGHGLLNVDAAVQGAIEESNHPSRAYADVDQNAWYQTPIGYVDYAVGEGYLVGDAGRFRPDDATTRAEGTTVLWRILDPDAAAAYEGRAENETAFSDVDANAWYTGAVNWASENRVVNGFDAATFDPDGVLTVEQLCSILANAFAAPDDVAKADLSSVDALEDGADVSSWARRNVAWCLQEGLVNGYETDEGTFLCPLEPLSRARFAGLLYNLGTEGYLDAADHTGGSAW